MQLQQIIFYLVLCITCVCPLREMEAIGIQKIQGEELSSKNLGFLTPRGHKGNHGKHGRRGKRGATGATGATGASGTGFTNIYGSASRAATDITSNPTDIIPFEVTGVLSGVAFAANTFTIQTAGVYRVAYVVNTALTGGSPVQVALNLVGSGVIANTTRELATGLGNDKFPLAFSGNLSLNVGDQIQVINNGANSFTLGLDNPGSAFTVIKVGEL